MGEKVRSGAGGSAGTAPVGTAPAGTAPAAGTPRGYNPTMHEFGAGKSAIREVFEQTMALREQGRSDFWDFSIGNPAVPAPPQVNDVIREVLDELGPMDVHGYTPNNGWLATRQAIADDLNARLSAGVDADELILTAGASGAITSTIGALTMPGDEVIVLAPYFPEYRMYARAWGCACVEVPTLPETFQIDLAAVERAVTPRTRIVIVNSPNNPTGTVYDEKSLRALADLLRREGRRVGHPIYLLSDEPYREIRYDGAQPCWVPSLYENTVVCYSFSKSLSLAGERIGYALVPRAMRDIVGVRDAVLGAQRAVNTIAGSLMQRVIERVASVPAPVAEYARKRELLYGALADMGYDVVRPDGAFYLWMRALESDDQAFAARAAAEQGLYFVNSTDFGGSGYVRLSYAVDDAQIESSLPAFARLWESYGGYAW
ncbi:MAG: pyridoxal phosphate-dependent aminotransferase [Olsenella sp.]|nr:pyridoxal phosphate-dependent aminotransferase [Olsenella sp.]